MDPATPKLVLAGPVGAGKTTAIRSIADGDPVSTEAPLTVGATLDKLTTTVAFDFATIVLDDGTPVLIYGLPGQEHFAFMRSIVMQGALGALILLNARDGHLDTQAEYWLDALREVDPILGVVIGITHSECVPGFSLAPVRALLRRRGEPIPVFTFDARVREQAQHLVRALLISVLP